MHVAYFDCFSGISGDMTLGALIDLGVPADWLQQQIEALSIHGFRLETACVHRNGIRATDVTVHVDPGDAAHRHFADIRAMIAESALPERVIQRSIGIFERIAVAEGAIHGCPVDEVHFHEVGGMDAIVDIVGSALGLEYLNVEKVVASSVAVGSGFVDCRHGILPVPAPATLEILRGVKVHGAGVPAEIVTPTGAGIVARLSESFGPPPPMQISRIGYGAGKRELGGRPNLLRILLGEADGLHDLHFESVAVVETAIDDMNPEHYGFLMERLFEQGALDVSWSPIYMKKNRPGTAVQVICRESDREAIVGIVLTETTTTGVRYRSEQRALLERTVVTEETSLGSVRMKIIRGPGAIIRKTPEYEDCRRIARQRRMPLGQVYDRLRCEISDPNGSPA